MKHAFVLVFLSHRDMLDCLCVQLFEAAAVEELQTNTHLQYTKKILVFLISSFYLVP